MKLNPVKLNLARHDAKLTRTRADYAARFDAIEATIAVYADESAQVTNDRTLSPEGVSGRLDGPRSDAYNACSAIASTVAGWAADDRAAIDDILEQPEPPQSAETLAELSYRQQLALRKYGKADVDDILADLAAAVEAGDAIVAQVLADLVEATPPVTVTTANAATELERSAQRERLLQDAIGLRATGDRAAALRMRGLLDVAVDPTLAVVKQTLGDRLSLIDAKLGKDSVKGTYSLDWPIRRPGSRWSPNWGLTGLEGFLLGIVPGR